MAESYRPPSITRLADVDMKSTPYGEDCVFIEGVVTASGQSAAIRDAEGFNSHAFSVAPWRQVGGPLMESELLVIRAIPSDHNWSPDFPPHSTQRMSVLLSLDKRRAVFNQSFPLGEVDEEMKACAERLRQPVVVVSDEVGELAFNPKLKLYEAKADWNGEEIDIRIEADEDRGVGDGLQTIKSLWAKQREWKARIEQFAVQELLPLKNGSWLEDEPELTEADFLARMCLDAIAIQQQGEFDFWHFDGGMFSDHSITISGQIKTGPTRADIPG